MLLTPAGAQTVQLDSTFNGGPGVQQERAGIVDQGPLQHHYICLLDVLLEHSSNFLKGTRCLGSIDWSLKSV